MSKLFETTSINQMNLANRFVRSATYEGLAELDGTVTPRLCNFMETLTNGNLGLIITAHAYVSPEGQAGPRQMGIHSDDMLPGLRSMADAVHGKGGKVIVQIAHAGIHGIGADTFEPVGPSQIKTTGSSTVHEMTSAQIAQTVAAFGAAAVRAKKSGYDGVQIHAAHGYLISQYLSPFYNKREDNYGGSLDNRARFLLEILGEIRSRTGNEFAVLVKMNSEDFLENGLTRDEMIAVAKMLEKNGIDAIELSGGTFDSGDLIPVRTGVLNLEEKEVYYREAASLFKAELSVPLILVGGIISYNVAERLIDDGLADYIALSRSLIREPGLVKRWQSGDHTKATCISCNKCFGTHATEEGLSCGIDNIQAAKGVKES